MNTTLPDFFIVGAPKAGTTSMSAYLSAHPDIFFSDPKEPHYFNDDFSARHTYDFDTYIKYFAGVERHHRAVGEGSVFYLASKTAIPNILKYCSSAKFIVMLRNPVEAVCSWHMETMYSHGENVRDIEKAWRLQERRRNGDCIPKSNRVREALQYGSLYLLGEQVKRLLSVVPASQVHFVLFDLLCEDSEAEYRKVLDFIGLTESGSMDFSVHNSAKIKRVPMLEGIVNSLTYMKGALGFHRSLGLAHKLMQINTKKLARKPLSERFRGELESHFHEDVSLLSECVGVDFNEMWLNRRE